MKKEFFKPLGDEELPEDITRYIYKLNSQILSAQKFITDHYDMIRDKKLASAIADDLHSNYLGAFFSVPPKSAFYTFFPKTKILVIETSIDWTHNYLRDNFDYSARIQEYGAHIRSGHFCADSPSSYKDQTSIALFDSLSHGKPVSLHDPEYLMILTLAQNKILPLTEDGFVVELA